MKRFDSATPLPCVLSYFQQGCLVLAINRAENSNAWSESISRQIVDKLLKVESDPSAKAVVITGTGDFAFSVGQVTDDRPSPACLARCYNTIRSFSKPIVAALNGDAIGIGFCITQLCDVAIGPPTVRIGLEVADCRLQESLSTWLPWSRIGRRAAERLLHDRIFTANEAQSLGLLHRLVDSDSLIHDSIETALHLAGKPTVAYSLSKKAIRAMTEERYADALRQDAKLSGMPVTSPNKIIK